MKIKRNKNHGLKIIGDQNYNLTNNLTDKPKLLIYKIRFQKN